MCIALLIYRPTVDISFFTQENMTAVHVLHVSTLNFHILILDKYVIFTRTALRTGANILFVTDIEPKLKYNFRTVSALLFYFVRCWTATPSLSNGAVKDGHG
jgi:hypothetical protein